MTTDPVGYLRNSKGGEGECAECTPNTSKGVVFGRLARLGWGRMRDLGELHAAASDCVDELLRKVAEEVQERK